MQTISHTWRYGGWGKRTTSSVQDGKLGEFLVLLTDSFAKLSTIIGDNTRIYRCGTMKLLLDYPIDKY